MLATVVELWRYPVKSLLGEVLDEVTLEQRGVVGDRLYAVTDRNGKLGSGKTTTRFRRLDGLFELRARVADEQTLVTLPDGRELAQGDPALDAFLSDRYSDELRVARENAVSASRRVSAASAHDRFGGMAREQLPASQIDRRRFRPNMLLDAEGRGLVEDAWVGRRFALGDAVIRVIGPQPIAA